MSVDQRVVGASLIAVVALAAGIAARLGLWRSFEAAYRNPELPVAFRNTPFALVPLGLAFASGLVAGLLDLPPSLRNVSLLLFALFPAWSLVAIIVANRPPRILLPKWLLDAEREAPGFTRQTRTWFDVAVFVAMIGLGIGSLGSFLLLIALKW